MGKEKEEKRTDTTTICLLLKSSSPCLRSNTIIRRWENRSQNVSDQFLFWFMHAKDLGLSPPDHVFIHLRGVIGLFIFDLQFHFS